MRKKNPIVSLITLVAFICTMAMPLAAFAKPGDPPQTTVTDGTPRVDQKIDITVQPAKVVLPRRQTVKVEGTVPIEGTVTVTTGGAPLPVEGTITVKGDPESPLPVRVTTDRPLPMTIVDPIELKPTPRYEFEKTWWFWTAVGIVTTGVVVGGVCGGGLCGGTHHNTVTFQ